MAPRTRRALFSLVVFLATCGFLGSVISQKVAAQSASDESSLRDSLNSFTSIYSQALDSAGNPTAVPPLIATDPTEERRKRQAELRRSNRLEERAQIVNDRAPSAS